MELLKRQEKWNITYTHALGETASWFFVQIRDHAKIYGRRCGKTRRVLVPPRAFSDQTLEPTTEWVEVGPDDPAGYWGSGPGIWDQACRIGSQIAHAASTSSLRAKSVASPRIVSRISRS